MAAIEGLEIDAMNQLDSRNWKTDYIAVRRQDNLQKNRPGAADAPLVILAASRLGKTRLIDNLEI